MSEEEYFCLSCFCKIPRTNYHKSNLNAAEERFKGKIPYQKVSSFLFYSKDGRTQQIIAEIKYKGNPKLGKWMGKLMAREMIKSSFFEEIDIIVPVPLHQKRLKSRGYNQSEEICSGISEIYNIPISKDHLSREEENPSQTKKGVFERWVNTNNIFRLKQTDYFENKHVLIVDDVLTTGSTIEACAHPILSCKNAKISVLTLAIAQ